jgi:hypothetical protein
MLSLGEIRVSCSPAAAFVRGFRHQPVVIQYRPSRRIVRPREFTDMLIKDVAEKSDGSNPIGGLTVDQLRSCPVDAGRQR